MYVRPCFYVGVRVYVLFACECKEGTGVILNKDLANERRHCNVTSSLWTQSQKDSWERKSKVGNMRASDVIQLEVINVKNII